jgi:hypothetical protein
MRQTLKGMDTMHVLIVVIIAVVATATIIFVARTSIQEAFTQAMDIKIN